MDITPTILISVAILLIPLVFTSCFHKNNDEICIKTITQYSGKEVINKWEAEGEIRISTNHVSFKDKNTGMPVYVYGTIVVTKKCLPKENKDASN